MTSIPHSPEGSRPDSGQNELWVPDSDSMVDPMEQAYRAIDVAGRGYGSIRHDVEVLDDNDNDNFAEYRDSTIAATANSLNKSSSKDASTAELTPMQQLAVSRIRLAQMQVAGRHNDRDRTTGTIDPEYRAVRDRHWQLWRKLHGFSFNGGTDIKKQAEYVAATKRERAEIDALMKELSSPAQKTERKLSLLRGLLAEIIGKGVEKSDKRYQDADAAYNAFLRHILTTDPKFSRLSTDELSAFKEEEKERLRKQVEAWEHAEHAYEEISPDHHKHGKKRIRKAAKAAGRFIFNNINKARFSLPQ